MREGMKYSVMERRADNSGGGGEMIEARVNQNVNNVVVKTLESLSSAACERRVDRSTDSLNNTS